MNIGAFEQVALDPVFAALGLDSELRRTDRTNVLCVVSADTGSSNVSAVGVVTDNRTGATRHVMFSPNGGVPSTGVINVAKASPVRQPTTPGPPSDRRRRAVGH